MQSDKAKLKWIILGLWRELLGKMSFCVICVIPKQVLICASILLSKGHAHVIYC